MFKLQDFQNILDFFLFLLMLAAFLPKTNLGIEHSSLLCRAAYRQLPSGERQLDTGLPDECEKDQEAVLKEHLAMELASATN